MNFAIFCGVMLIGCGVAEWRTDVPPSFMTTIAFGLYVLIDGIKQEALKP